jgi:hypothetical protein
LLHSEFEPKGQMNFTTFFVIFLLLSYSPVIRSASSEDSYFQQACDQLNLSVDQCCVADKVLKFLGYGGLAAATSTYGIPFVLGKLGFSTVGIAGGSFAAWWQSTGLAPGLFATIQSFSMTGAAASIMTKIGVSAAGVKSYFSSCDVKTSSNSEHCKKNHKC